MTVTHANGRKRLRIDKPFTLHHGLALLIQAGSATLTAVLVAATRSLDQALQHDSVSLHPSQPLPPPVWPSLILDSSARRNADEVDEEDWHNGQQAASVDRHERHPNGSSSSSSSSSSTVKRRKNTANNNSNDNNDHTVAPLRVATSTTTAASGSAQHSSPRVKLEPVSANRSKQSSASNKQSRTSSKKRQMRSSSSATTEDERAVKTPRRAKHEASDSTPAAKRVLYQAATES